MSSAQLPTSTDDSRVASDPDLISPTSNPAASASATIVPTHFPHKPQVAAPVHPFIDTAKPAMNSVPIELDSTPVTSPVGNTNIRTPSWKVGVDGLAAVVAGKERLKVDDRAVMDKPPGTPAAEDFQAVQAEGGLETPS